MYTEDLILKLKGKSIAIVGNSKFIYPYGDIIDEHDVVIRFNAFHLDGFEEYCGRKVTHWCTFGDVPHNRLPTQHRQGLRPFSPFIREAVESSDIIPDFENRMIFAREDYRAGIVRAPSTGFMLALMLERLGLEADFYGFDGFTTGHYYEEDHTHDPNHQSGELAYLVSKPYFYVYIHATEPVRPVMKTSS